ncbi:type II toxin-antitoxin system RelE/ParE family toxin [Gracilimonas sp.]|uniref:type II toxin-antitoxin system RelE/ParE family toxin n=1 Tax=Gracilimonas sp. TaxID=1974203 RepID=UPI00287110FE|nr:type II toxin-antitoxin system RelE/ParE family toxin [Gracilimonas sp.]
MKVYLSPLAEYKLEKLLTYLEEEWGKKIRDNYLEQFVNKTIQVSNFPSSNPKIDEFDGVIKCVVTSQSSFYYRIRQNEVEIITLVDTRQKPDRIIKEIRDHFKS